MANESESATKEVAGDLTDEEILAGFGFGEDVNDLTGGDDDTADDEESEADAGGENAGEDDDADDADDEDAEDSEDEGDDDSEEEEDSDEEEDDDQEEDEKLPKSVEALQKRVGTLTKRTKTAEAERDQARAKVADLQTKLEKAAPTVLQPNPHNPLADLTTEEAVQTRLEQFKALKRWCRENPDGGTLKNAAGEDVELDAKAVRQRLDYAEEVLTDYGPARLQFLKMEQTAEPVIRKAYPALFEDDSEDRKIMDNFIRVCPAILTFPTWKLVIGDSIRGMRERLKEEKEKEKKPGVDPKKKEPTKEKKPAPRAIKPAPAKTITQKKAKTSKKLNDFMQTGSKSALTDWVESTL